MKRAILLTLAACLIVIPLASCSNYKENTWFSSEKLVKYAVPDLTVPSVSESVLKNDEIFYSNMTAENFESYILSVYEYLKLQNFKYFGTRGEQKTTLAGALTTYYFKPSEELSDFRAFDGASYRFVFSDGRTDENGEPIFFVLAFYRSGNNGIKYDGKTFSYNLKMVLREKDEVALGGGYVIDTDAGGTEN